MAPKQPVAKYQYVVTPAGPKILPVEEPSCKDEESPADYNTGGYLPVKVNDTFKHGRYRIVRKLGWGHFSTVWLVKDADNNRHSALKVVKSAGRYAETARDEITLLSRVSSFSPEHPGRAHIVSFLDSFSHQGPEASHICIVFEPLGENLLALIERHKKKGVPRPLVKVIAKQMLLGLEYLHDECDLVHTDIKPENILISIPDIEAHIHNELSQSPSPTSRRVGVPLPAKSRAGVSIPQNQHRARRQVQIFDSQPLASPGRTTGRTANAGSNSMSINGRHNGSGSGSNSVNGSYITQVHLSRVVAVNTVASNSAGSPNPNAPKVSSGLSSSAPHSESMPSRKSQLVSSTLTAPSQPPGNTTSPSTSSSSSSISSTAAGSSSIVSTPPTSLSYSIGNVVAGKLGMSTLSDRIKASDSSPTASTSHPTDDKFLAFSGQGKAIGDDFEHSLSTSWRDCSHVATSWKDKLSTSLSTSFRSSGLISSKLKISHTMDNNQIRSQLGVPASDSWKDPGAAAPAPAVVISALVNSFGEEEGDDYFRHPGPSRSTNTASTGSSTTSESSSATTTTAKPSPDSTPHPVSNNGSKSKILGIDKIITNAPSLLADAMSHQIDASSSDPTPNPTNLAPSLLTQTAPNRADMAHLPTKRHTPRSSPPQQISQLSAQMQCYSRSPHEPHSLSHNDLPSNEVMAITSNADDPLISPEPTVSEIAHTLYTPAAPPPTPNTSPSVPFRMPTTYEARANPTVQPPTPAPSHAPPIRIKIADLGNATPSKKHYTEDIQTRQYRAPEAILGKRDWDTRADIWSVGCVIFELLTAEYLFDPQGQGELFTKDDDHMAQIIELLGDFPMEVKMGGKYSREMFDHTGALRYIRTLKPWPLKRVMTEKYLYLEEDASRLCEFLEPMLAVDMKKRLHSREMVNHPWLEPQDSDDIVSEW